MAFESLLISTCTVSRFTTAANDAYGQPVKMWAAHLSAQPCRLSGASGKEVQIGAEVVIADAKLFIGDVDVTEKDRVIIGSLIYEIIFVATIQNGLDSHHKEALLRVVH